MSMRFGAGISKVSLLATVEVPSVSWVLHSVLRALVASLCFGFQGW
jgi:hypothetical protein